MQANLIYNVKKQITGCLGGRIKRGQGEKDSYIKV